MKQYGNTRLLFALFLSLAATAIAERADATQLRLSWIDASNNEDGFEIERRLGEGKYKHVGKTGRNVTTYVDSNVVDGATYCYRVRAYNRGGNSQYSNSACGTSRAYITIVKAGSGAGTVRSLPGGINCGSTCSATYAAQTIVTLTAVPAGGSVFTGWSGPKDCRDGTVTMDANKKCIAKFNRLAPGHGPNVAAANQPANPAFAAKSNPPASVTRSNPPASAAKSNSAASAAPGSPSAIGVFRPSTGDWFLDSSGSGFMAACNVESCVRNLGQEGDVPVAGSWTGAPTMSLGLFDTSTASWYLDLNDNGILDGCEPRSCRRVYGSPGDVPVVGDWTGGGADKIGVFRPSTGEWYFDLNGNGVLDSCSIDRCLTFGAPGDIPVVGDWNGEGQTKIGIFRPSTGEWLLDSGDAGETKDCADDCIIFGAPGDLPVVGDWDGGGADKIGVFRPSTGEWLLDLNGNGNWDGCGLDLCLGPFGAPGDLPIVGKWL
ncbi:MAG TPA: fibronectin type III domain-containing protein [Candidatus Binatia bacterium]|jgi:hypothetical protein